MARETGVIDGDGRELCHNREVRVLTKLEAFLQGRVQDMDDRNPYAPSKASLSHDRSPSESPGSQVTAWRNVNSLVMIPGSTLPDRCVKCNEPADEPTKVRKVYWHHPGLYALILINIIIYAIVGAIVRKRALVAAGLCVAHKKRRRLGITLAWVGSGCGVALIVLSTGDRGSPATFAAGILMIVAAVIVGIIMGRIVYAQKIDEEYIWLKGCGAEFLDSLPPLP